MLGQIVSKTLNWKWKQIQRQQRHPLASQQKALDRLAKGLSGTRVAHAMGLIPGMRYEDFCKKGQATAYSDYERWIEQQLNGKPSLYHSNTQFVGLSSGTTANSKKILFNREVVSNFQSFQFSVAALLQKHTDLKVWSDPRLTWGSTAVVQTNEYHIDEGYVSGFLATQSPRLIRPTAFPCEETQRLEDINEKTWRTLEEAYSQDIRLISGVPSYMINLLEEARQRYGVDQLSKIWPNLQAMLYSATGISCYRQQLDELVGTPLQYLGLYVSTEGPFGYEIPSIGNGGSGIYSFHYGDLVYSFRKDGHPTPLSMADLEPGDEVELLVSSPNGFLHYSTGDCIRIRSITPFVTFEVLGRVGQGLNIATEKVSMVELQRALGSVMQTRELPVQHFFLYPGKGADAKPCYEWVLVTDRKRDQIPPEIESDLDRALMRENDDYRENRENLYFLGKPKVNVVSPDVFQRYFEQHRHRGQLKMKSCFDSYADYAQFVESLYTTDTRIQTGGVA